MAAEDWVSCGPLKILIIDDDQADRAICKFSLEAADPGGFQFAEAATGSDGLARVSDFQPDCVLLDFQLPDLDGLKMVRRLQEGGDFLPCAIVMLTAIGNERIAVEAMKLGVMDYLPKGPASAEALSRTVASAVQRFRLQQQIAEQRRALEERNLELEETRSELFEEKERYRTLAEAIPQLVWTADSLGSVHYANRRLCDFSGKEDSKIWPLASLVHSEDRAELRDRWSEAVRSGRPFETEVRLYRASDHTWRWHLMRTVPTRSAEDGPVKWCGTFTDIEDQKRASEALRQRQKLDSIGLLAGGIAHDFNNLLVGIMGGASFALESLEPEHALYPMLKIILQSSERAAYLTRQLLAYAGKGQNYPELVSIPRIVCDTCELLRPTLPKGVSLVIDADKDVPAIETNASQMEQLIINLGMNAAEAIEAEGVITVRTALECVGGGDLQENVLGYGLPIGRYALIEVSDTGSGMDEKTQAQIFDPFFTTKFVGRGLGLAAVQGIVRSLGGGIQLSSVPAQGSTFRILIPYKLTEAERGASGEGGPASEERTVILLVEPEGNSRNGTATFLQSEGYEVLTRAGANDCVAALTSERERIGLVMLDVELPDWREILARLREVCRVPVAILSLEDPNDLFAEGVDNLDTASIRKPLTPASIEQHAKVLTAVTRMASVRGERGAHGAGR